MLSPGMFRYLQPSFFSGLLDDPVMFIGVRPTGRGILLDCGQIHHLAKRILRSIDALFISHAHMDHLMGFDHLLRHVLVAPRTISLYGPPGIAERIGHKLAGYDWNLTEENWCSFMVYEVHPERIEQFEFAGSRGFAMQRRETKPRTGRIIYQTRYLKVEAELCDHRIPVLVFRVTEGRAFLLDRQQLDGERLVPGPWIRELKRRFHADDFIPGPIEVWRAAGDGHVVETVEDARALYTKIRRDATPASIGYLSDVGMTPENLNRIHELMRGVTLLVSECTFLKGDEGKARVAYHLCTTDLNRISEELQPQLLLPMHLSKAYMRDTRRLYAELEPPQGATILRLPDYITTRPLLPGDLPALGNHNQDR